jgi:hypothetical protein
MGTLLPARQVSSARRDPLSGSNKIRVRCKVSPNDTLRTTIIEAEFTRFTGEFKYTFMSG